MDCLTASAAQNQEFMETTKPTWKSLLTVESGGIQKSLIFGMYPSASDGFDGLFDKPLPPSPITASDDFKKRGNGKLSGIPEAAWLVEDPIFSMLCESYVKDGNQGIWQLSVELLKPGKINWDNLPDRYRCILHYNECSVDMKARKFLPLPLGKHQLTLVLDSR